MAKQTFMQSILRWMYPLIKKLGKKGKNGTTRSNPLPKEKTPRLSDLSVPINNGTEIELQKLRGKKVVLVNTASNCGYTGQYDELQSLYDQARNKIEIIAFPANDFANQEKGSDASIAEFCRMNYGVDFPVAKKSSVIKGDQQNVIFQWLSDETKNGWNDVDPVWNFSKYILDEEGRLTHFYGPSVSPLDAEFKKALELK